MCEEQILEAIIRLHKNRILGRLDSPKFARPAHLRGGFRLPLVTRLQNLLNLSKRRSRSSEIQDMMEQFSRFKEAVANLENDSSSLSLYVFQAVVKAAFVLTIDGTKFGQRLAAIGCSQTQVDGREAREVGKLANYLRITRTLVKFCRHYAQLVSSMEWMTILPYRPSNALPLTKQQFVHAEIQLLVYYELHPTTAEPRAIGCSKEACFLCDAFIRAHGRFMVSRAHRQIYSQWALPDLYEYQSSTVDLFRSALCQVVQDVSSEHSGLPQKTVRSWFPLQSSINLRLPFLPTPSLSTLRSRKATVNTVKRTNETSAHSSRAASSRGLVTL